MAALHCERSATRLTARAAAPVVACFVRGPLGLQGRRPVGSGPDAGPQVPVERQMPYESAVAGHGPARVNVQAGVTPAAEIRAAPAALQKYGATPPGLLSMVWTQLRLSPG